VRRIQWGWRRAGELLNWAVGMPSSKIDSLLGLLRNPRWQLVTVFILVFLSRLPFLDTGYGVNVDGWRVARVAREIATTGEYSVSRFPGYPVQEIICSWFWRGGPFALNALSAFFGAIAATAFAAIARRLGGRDSLLAGLALAATPIFFISSVGSKDYVWAIAFVLLSMLAALHNRAVLAGMLLGLGIGCRVTSLSILLPLALFVFSISNRAGRVTFIAKLVAAAVITAMIALSPVWIHYGGGFWQFYQHGRPDWLTILNRGTVEIWGTLGLLGLALGVCALTFNITRSGSARRWDKPAGPASPASEKSWILSALVLWIAITVALYLRLPDQAGYLLPLVPAVVLLAQQLAPRRLFQFVCACLILSPFVDLSRHGVKPGPIFVDQTERLRMMQQVKDFVGYAETLPGRNTIVVGAWEPIIATLAPNISHGRNHYVYLLDESALAAVLARHEPIFYAPQMREFNQRIYRIDLASYGATDLREFYLRQRARE
jgi:hypothetical protein